MGETDRYIETFRMEADELLADVEDIVLAIEDDPSNRSNIDRLFRAMHTIKGSGAMFGFDDVAAFTHHVETTLDVVRSGGIGIGRELIDLILAARDQITAMMAAAGGGPVVDEGESRRIVEGLGALLPKGDSLKAEEAGGSSSGGDAGVVGDASAEMASYKIVFAPDPGIFLTGMDPSLLLEELRELGECQIIALTENLPALEMVDPEKCYLAWQINLRTDKGVDAIRDVFIFVEDTSRIEIEQLPELQVSASDDEPKKLGQILVEKGLATEAQVRGALGKQKMLGDILVGSGVVGAETLNSALAEQKTQEKAKGAEKSETLRVASDKLDVLVNLVGELVINQARLSQVSGAVENSELLAAVEEVERLTGELRDVVLNIRMMPIGTTFGRFKRLVRDTSVELGKEIDLVTEGAETEIDKTVIDRLADPLVHLIRNSIDHAIESPEARLGMGKPRKGTILLSAAHRGTNVVITVKDDGKGLDAEVIKAKAIERGLISADQDLSEKEIFALIFAPGFSTAQNVTSMSGRGVGMDVVRREIDALRGNVSVTSEKGKGTTVDLSLPLTLAIIDGLLVAVNNERFVIPLSTVEECLELTGARFAMSRERNVIQVRGEPVPFVRLREMFGIEGTEPDLEETIVVGVGESRIGIVVDHVIGDHQTVIKSLGKAYRHVEGLSGATIMGDGSVALILDVPGLVDCALQAEDAALKAA